MENTNEKEFLSSSITEFRKLKNLAERALAQLQPADYHWQADNESNSIATIMKHISGNMISRWTDFLTTDGEKPTRNRDIEFIDDIDSVEAITANWERGWECLFNTLSSLNPGDLNKTVYIRKEPHSVIKAILRQLAHYAGHVYQIVFIAKHLKSENWQSLSIPKGKSADFLR